MNDQDSRSALLAAGLDVDVWDQSLRPVDDLVVVGVGLDGLGLLDDVGDVVGQAQEVLLELVVADLAGDLELALGEISEDVVRLDGLDKDHFRLACTRRIERHLVSVVTNATCFLRDLGVEDPAAAFVAEWERAAVKHPGMTLDCDGPTDENRFYALAEEVGEVAASLTYDNAQGTGHGADTVAEVTQVGALALAWLVRYQDGGER